MVHTFTQCGYNIAVATASGSVHVVDEIALDVINNFEHINEAKTVSEIAKRHGVTEKDIEEWIADVQTLV